MSATKRRVPAPQPGIGATGTDPWHGPPGADPLLQGEEEQTYEESLGQARSTLARPLSRMPPPPKPKHDKTWRPSRATARPHRGGAGRSRCMGWAGPLGGGNHHRGKAQPAGASGERRGPGGARPEGALSPVRPPTTLSPPALRRATERCCWRRGGAGEGGLLRLAARGAGRGGLGGGERPGQVRPGRTDGQTDCSALSAAAPRRRPQRCKPGLRVPS